MPLAQLQRTELALQTKRFSLHLAQDADELAAAQRLRFDIFNLELGEGLAASYRTGRDEDPFDEQCDHLLLTDNASDQLVGTYRLQTAGMAAEGRGFYAATEFDLSYLPASLLRESIELGRACIAPEQRHSEALLLLWRGIAAYAQQTGKRYLFGCCSLRSRQPRDGWVLTRQLGNDGHLHARLFVPPLPGFECDDRELFDDAAPAPVALPKLLQSYLRFGAKVCSPPALDRQFGTIDFFTWFDLGQLNERARKLLAD
jgi:putative hemolysin